MILHRLFPTPDVPASRRIRRVWAMACCLFAGATTHAATYYVHATKGDDRNAGTSASAPWQTLDKVNATRLQAGDRVLLASGERYAGQLAATGLSGTGERPILFASYTPDSVASDLRPTIDARGYVAAVHLKDCSHIQVQDLALTADGGGLKPGQLQTAAMRCGVLVEAQSQGDYDGVKLSRLQVTEISYEEPGFVRPPGDVNTANGTLPYGWGIRFIVGSSQARMREITVADCKIENVNHTGLKFTGPVDSIQAVTVERVTILNVGGPGVQMSGVRGGHFSHLEVNGSGSARDSRNWARGSGLWTWSTRDVVIEKSRFLNANGPGDSAGVHIDYNCRNVVVQYNVSAGNAGGFCEILGNNHNCSYRYNISVNDGHRVKGRQGALQEGKTFWLSGYVGKGKRTGPTNTYFYNNTIYVSAEIVAKMAVAPTTDGVLIANNIFYIKGESRMVKGDQFRPDDSSPDALNRVRFARNLFLRVENWPAEVGIRDQSPLIGDPQFARGGGLGRADYTPGNRSLVKDQGLVIEGLPGDDLGLALGLRVREDILGNPIVGPPDLGAIEVP